MSAYIVGQITIHDPETYARYREEVPDVIARFGGRYLTRGGPVGTLEGDPFEQRMVIVEFPSRAAAERFHSSADYAPLKALRQAASTGQLLVQDGI